MDKDYSSKNYILFHLKIETKFVFVYSEKFFSFRGFIYRYIELNLFKTHIIKLQKIKTMKYKNVDSKTPVKIIEIV